MRIQPLRNRRLLVISLASIFICLAATSAWSSRTPQQDKIPFPVVNKTQGVEITKIEVIDKSIHVTFKNVSGKKITAFVLGFDEDDSVSSVSEDFLVSGGGIPAGETHSVVHSIPQSYSPHPRTGELRFVLMGLVFEDHSTDGDPATIRPIEESRIGTRLFLTQALPLIRDSIDLEGAENLVPLAPLEQRIASLNLSAHPQMPEGVLSGFKSARESMMRELDELKPRSDHGNLRERLTAKLTRDEEFLLRLQPR
jgi:hypothetical protein